MAIVKFLISLIVAALAIVAFVYFGVDQQWFSAPSFLNETLILLTFCTALIYLYLYKSDKPDFFIQLYLLTMVIKLLAYGAYAFFMVLTDKGGAKANVVFFMAVYMVFTILEIAFLYKKVSGNAAG